MPWLGQVWGAKGNKRKKGLGRSHGSTRHRAISVSSMISHATGRRPSHALEPEGLADGAACLGDFGVDLDLFVDGSDAAAASTTFTVLVRCDARRQRNLM